MKSYTVLREKQVLFVGIDIHQRTYHATGVWEDGREEFARGMPADKEILVKYLMRWGQYRIVAVYEAGYFGYTLHDYLIEHGIECMVTPPSLVPGAYGNRVKTDRRDSRKLALYCAKGFLKCVYVPTEEERSHRQVIRTRRQLVKDRIRKQNQIKSFLTQYGIPFPDVVSKWSKQYIEKLNCIRLRDRWLQKSFEQLIRAYEFVDKQVEKQTNLLKELAKEERYRERVAILRSIPGIGIISAMELLLELQDVERFSTADQLAAYVGLTPSQFSSGDRVRMGRITRIGKQQLRALLVEAAWIFVRKDVTANEIYTRIRTRAGSKRAIVAIARRLLLIGRRLLINNKMYARIA
jgi:transposase